MPAKQLIIVGGPNGAGKTTFAEEYLARHHCVYLGADAIAAELAPDDPTSQRFEAGREFIRRVEGQLNLPDNFVIESTLAGRSVGRLIQRAKQSGFEVTIVFVFLDVVESCIERVKQRVRNGGHDVPEADIRRRYTRSIANFWREYRKIADDWVLVYNVGSEFVDVAIGDHVGISVLDEIIFRDFSNFVEFDFDV